MIKGIGHIGIAVKNIEETLKAFTQALNLSLPPIKEIPERKLKVAVLNLGGVGLEFIQDDSKDGEFATLVRERGNSIHHFCLLTDEIEADLQTLKNRGVELADEKPKMGVRGKRIAFVKKNLLGGVSLELSEP